MRKVLSVVLFMALVAGVAAVATAGLAQDADDGMLPPIGVTAPVTPVRPGLEIGDTDPAIDEETGFALSAFPPTIPDTAWHRDAWMVNDCMRCHETGVGDAPQFRHTGLPHITRVSKCRTCHVLIPGQAPPPPPAPVDDGFLPNAFPPMMPNSLSHRGAWVRDNCLLCHTSGVRGAPAIVHEGLPALTLKVKCRTCHVQVRSHETRIWE
jgi:hypothetical protein